ncbi:MAG: proton-conducting transporter membrane subunit [Ignisphaera sp.]
MISYEQLLILVTLSSVTLMALATIVLKRLGRRYDFIPIYIAIATTLVQMAIALSIRGLTGLVGVVSALVSLISEGYIISIRRYIYTPRKVLISMLLVLFNSLTMLVTLATTTQVNDIIKLFIYWEGLSYTTIAALNIRHTREEYEATMKYVLVCVIGSLMALIGIVLSVAECDSTSISVILSRASVPSKMFIVIGFLTEAAVFPFYFWVPDADVSMLSTLAIMHMGAVTPVATYVAGLFAYNGGALIRNLVSALSILTAFIGSLASLFQSDFRRLLAYSTVAHMNYLVLAFANNVVDYGALHILAHALSKVPVFLIAYTMLEMMQIREVGYAYMWDNSLARYVIVASSLGLLGLPPFLTFWSELFIFLKIFALGSIFHLYAALFFIVIVVSTGYAFKIIYSCVKKSESDGDRMSVQNPKAALLLLATTSSASIILFMLQGYIISYFF